VLVFAAPELQRSVEAAGLSFLAEPPEAKSFISHFLAKYPERDQKEPGMEMIRFDVQFLFGGNMAMQAAGLDLALREFPADVIVADTGFWGTLPMLVGPRSKRPAVVHVGFSVLNLWSGKNVPVRAGSTEEERLAERKRREAMILKPAQDVVNKVLGELGCPPLPCPALEAMSRLPDLYLHQGIKSFEYPDKSGDLSHVHYIGSLPLPAGQTELPEWWSELDRTKRLVLVTQGTLANREFGQLIGPTLTALANEKDVIILATTGGQPIESIPVEIPANARVASFLPFERILPEIDLLITNGGFGTVNMALARGVPMVVAGMTEDKEEITQHVQWSGIGLNLRTTNPKPEAVLAAAREVLDKPIYRARAKELALEFASHDTEKELLTLIEACVEDVAAVRT
jgi:UDP:flavonoid glycosyltransferase YjiC (YdhE family)